MAELLSEVEPLSNNSSSPTNEIITESFTTFSTTTQTPLPPLVVSGSFKEGKTSSRRRSSRRPSLDADDFLNLLHGSDPVKLELNRLENDVRGYIAYLCFIPLFFVLTIWVFDLDNWVVEICR